MSLKMKTNEKSEYSLLKTKEEKLNYLVKIVKQDMRDNFIPFDDNVVIKISKKASRALGRCHYAIDYSTGNKYADYIIINDCILSGDEQIAKNVICHELLHSAKECINHGHLGFWKKYAEEMSRKTNYNITRLANINEISNDELEKKYRYIIICKKCGKKYVYSRRTKIIQKIENKETSIKCSCCDSREFNLIKNF